MRTMHTLKSDAQEKVDYYEEDESLIDAHERYYGESELVSEVDRITRAMWAGTAAKNTGITGAIVREDFKTVLRGTITTTQERIRWENPNPKTKERLAHDVVLSAPKSISMALHLQGDMRVFDAHTEAVLETLELIEQEAAKTRIQVNGVRSVVHTGNLIAALIPHHTSRDGDMQLHTHMLIMNGTQGPDGVWRSLCHESLASAEWVGSYYRQKLAEKVQTLGYRIYETKDGFELEGYSREEIEVFSKRNRAIVRDVMNKGLEVNPENKKASVLTTRKAKSGIGKKIEDIQEQWRTEALEEGINGPVLDGPVEVNGSMAQGIQEVDSAIRHLSESSVSFSRSEIYAYTFKHIHQKGLLIEHLNDAIAQRKDLIPVRQGRLTTVDALEREISTFQKWNLGQGKARAIMETEAATLALMGNSLNSGQHEAVLRVASATDRHLIIQGLSGVGKTHALGELKRLIEASGQDITIKGYSPTLNAAQQLQDSLRIETHTVESLVRRETESKPNQLWIIDEAGMVGGEQMLTIVSKAEAVGARILLVGDIGQNPSVKAGSPMRNLMDNGATTFRLSQIIRQQNSMQRRAVELIANGQPVDALRLLNEHGYVQEIQAQGVRVKAIAEQYLSLNLSERSKTLIVTGTNAERQAITKAIRAGMKVEGSLGQERTILQLTNQYMSIEEKRRVENFEPGSYVQLLQDYKTTPLVKNKLYQVMGREGAELIVSSEGGRLYRFDPSKYGDKEVSKAEEFAVAVGDCLRWTASNKKAGQINGIEFTVIGMTEQQLIVADKKGTRIIETKQPLGVDYALVSTSYRAQGQTAKRVIVSATNGPTAAQEPFYVKISRQTHEIQVYAENIDRLKDWVQRSIAQENALDLIGESYGNGNQSRTEAGLNPSAASNAPTAERGAPTAKRSAPSAVPELAGPEREPELLGEGANEHVADGNEGLAQQLHRRVHGGDEQPEVGQDGRIHRQTLEGDGELGNQVRGLQSGESPDEHASRRVSGPNQGDLQTAAPERGAEATDAPEDWSRSHFTRLAAAVGQIQSESQLNEALAERIGRLSEQLERLSSNSLDEPFVGMAQLGQAVSEQSETAAWLEVTDSLSDLVESFERRSQMAELAKQLGSLAEAQDLNQSGFMESIESLHDSISQFSRTLPNSFEGLETLAQLLNESHQIEALSALSALSAQMEGLTKKLSQTSPNRSQFEGMGQLAAAVSASQQLQALQVEDLAFKVDALTEKLKRLQALNGQQFEHIDVLVQMLSDAVELEALSVLSDQAQTLTARLEGSVIPARAKRFENMSELAAAVVVSEQQQLLESSDLTAKIKALLEQVEGVLAERQPNSQFEGMSSLTETLSTQQQQSNLVEAIAQVGSELERVTEGLTYATRRDKAATIGAAIQQWRSEQFIAEQVLETNPEQAFESLEAVLIQIDAFGDVRPEMQALARSIEAWQSEQALSQTIEQLSERRSVPVHTWADISQLAQAISDRQAQESIAEHLETFNTFSEQLQEGLRQRSDLQKLGEAMRTLRSIELVEGPAAEQLQQIAQRLRQMEISPTPKPIKQQIFWRPNYTTVERPDNLEPKHWEEFQRSAIHPELIAANTESVSGEAVYERLLSERLAQMGTGQYVTQPMARLMAQYEQVAGGGWWGKAGIDARSLLNLQPGQLPQLSTWGCFKADSPRIDQDKSNRKGETELIKYENPLGVSRSLYLPILPDSLAERIYSKHDIEPTAAERQSGFWAVVQQYNLPITITEGAKKTWASLSQGEVTIGVSGVNGLYRAKDQEGNLLPGRQLNEEMAVFATPGREFRFAFDQDTKASTVRNVRRDMVRGIELLEAQGCTCKVASWKPADGKGLDDLIVNRGPAAYTSPIALAEPSDKAKRTHYRTEYNRLSRQVRVNNPEASPEQLDAEVYLRAKAKGDLKDGERFIGQSDQARSLKDPAQVTTYIEHIKAAAPKYLQQQRKLDIAQAQQASDRAQYETLAARIRTSPVQLSLEVIDMQVYLTAEREGSPSDGDRLIAQSDHAFSLHNKQAVSAYVEHIKTEAPLYLQRMSEQLDKANHRRLYEELTDAIQQENTGIQPAHSDMEVYLRAEAKGLDGESILAQSDSALILSNPDQAQAYIDQIIAEAPLYSQQKQERLEVQARHEQELTGTEANTTATASSQNDPTPVQVSEQRSAERPKPIRAITEPQKAQQKVDQAVASIKQELRAQYDDIVQQVKSKLGEVPPEIVDLEVYLKTKNPDQAKRLIHVGDKMTALMDADSDFTDSYSDAIAQVASAYDEIKNNPNAKLNHRMMVAIVNNTTAKLQLQKAPEPTIHRKKEREDELML